MTGWVIIYVCTACGHRIAYMKLKGTKLQPGTAGPGNMLGSCLVSFHILLANRCLQAVQDTSYHNYAAVYSAKSATSYNNAITLNSTQAQMGQATCLAVA